MDKKLMWFAAYLLSVTVTSILVQYLWEGDVDPLRVLSVTVGAVIGWVFIIRIGAEQLEPMVDERQQHHAVLSGYRAFLFLNLLIIGALLQPWVPYRHLGLWIGVLIAGLLFWVANLLILGWKR